MSAVSSDPFGQLSAPPPPPVDPFGQLSPEHTKSVFSPETLARVAANHPAAESPDPFGQLSSSVPPMHGASGSWTPPQSALTNFLNAGGQQINRAIGGGEALAGQALNSGAVPGGKELADIGGLGLPQVTQATQQAEQGMPVDPGSMAGTAGSFVGGALPVAGSMLAGPVGPAAYLATTGAGEAAVHSQELRNAGQTVTPGQQYEDEALQGAIGLILARAPSMLRPGAGIAAKALEAAAKWGVGYGLLSNKATQHTIDPTQSTTEGIAQNVAGAALGEMAGHAISGFMERPTDWQQHPQIQEAQKVPVKQAPINGAYSPPPVVGRTLPYGGIIEPGEEPQAGEDRLGAAQTKGSDNILPAPMPHPKPQPVPLPLPPNMDAMRTQQLRSFGQQRGYDTSKWDAMSKGQISGDIARQYTERNNASLDYKTALNIVNAVPTVASGDTPIGQFAQIPQGIRPDTATAKQLQAAGNVKPLNWAAWVLGYEPKVKAPYEQSIPTGGTNQTADVQQSEKAGIPNTRSVGEGGETGMAANPPILGSPPPESGPIGRIGEDGIGQREGPYQSGNAAGTAADQGLAGGGGNVSEAQRDSAIPQGNGPTNNQSVQYPPEQRPRSAFTSGYAAYSIIREPLSDFGETENLDEPPSLIRQAQMEHESAQGTPSLQRQSAEPTTPLAAGEPNQRMSGSALDALQGTSDIGGPAATSEVSKGVSSPNPTTSPRILEDTPEGRAKFLGRQGGAVPIISAFEAKDIRPALQRLGDAIKEGVAGFGRNVLGFTGVDPQTRAAKATVSTADSKFQAAMQELKPKTDPIHAYFKEEIAKDPDAGMKMMRDLDKGPTTTNPHPMAQALAAINQALNKTLKGIQIAAGNARAAKWDTDAFMSRAGNSSLVGWLDKNGFREDDPRYLGPDPKRGVGGSIAGRENSAKARTFNTFDEMASHIINEGGYLKSTNPVDWLMAGAADRLRSAYGRMAFRDAARQNLIRPMNAPEVPKYFLNDKAAKILGEQYGTDNANVRHILDHAADPNPLSGNKGLDYIDKAQQEAKIWRMLLGSVSHIFREVKGSTGQALGSASNLALQKEYGAAFYQLQHAIPGWGQYQLFKRAGEFQQAIENPGVNPKMDEITKAVIAGGGIAHTDVNPGMEITQKLKAAGLNKDNPLGWTVRAISKAVHAPWDYIGDKTSEFQKGVRSLKAVADITEAKARGIDLSSKEFRDMSYRSNEAIDQLIGSIGSDKQFQANGVKTAMRLAWGFPGWDVQKANLGMQALGDIPYAFRNRRISPAMQALGGTIAARVIQGMVVNAAMQAVHSAWSGKKADWSTTHHIHDILYPPLPGDIKDKNGDPLRLTADVDPLEPLYSAAHLTGVGTSILGGTQTGVGDYLREHASPFVQTLTDLATDKDFRGRTTRPDISLEGAKDLPGWRRAAATIGKTVEPMGLGNLISGDSPAGGPIGGRLLTAGKMVTGIGLAPSSQNQTPAEALAWKVADETGGTTEAITPQRDAELAAKPPKERTPGVAGIVSREDFGSRDPVERMKQLLSVWEAATPEEQKALRPVLQAKMMTPQGITKSGVNKYSHETAMAHQLSPDQLNVYNSEINQGASP